MKMLCSSLLLSALACLLAPTVDAQRVYASTHYGRGRPHATGLVWVPAGYETVGERVWVPGRAERVWTEPTFGLRLGSCGGRFRVMLAAGHWRTVHHPGHYEIRRVRVHVPGHWKKRC